MRNYRFRPITEADLPLMRRWLDTAHVKAWSADAENQIALMQQGMNNSDIDMRVVNLVDHVFAHIHDHDARVFNMRTCRLVRGCWCYLPDGNHWAFHPRWTPCSGNDPSLIFWPTTGPTRSETHDPFP